MGLANSDAMGCDTKSAQSPRRLSFDVESSQQRLQPQVSSIATEAVSSPWPAARSQPRLCFDVNLFPMPNPLNRRGGSLLTLSPCVKGFNLNSAQLPRRLFLHHGQLCPSLHSLWFSPMPHASGCMVFRDEEVPASVSAKIGFKRNSK
jgi:hypothetical protein